MRMDVGNETIYTQAGLPHMFVTKSVHLASYEPTSNHFLPSHLRETLSLCAISSSPLLSSSPQCQVSSRNNKIRWKLREWAHIYDTNWWRERKGENLLWMSGKKSSFLTLLTWSNFLLLLLHNKQVGPPAKSCVPPARKIILIMFTHSLTSYFLGDQTFASISPLAVNSYVFSGLHT